MEYRNAVCGQYAATTFGKCDYRWALNGAVLKNEHFVFV